MCTTTFSLSFRCPPFHKFVFFLILQWHYSFFVQVPVNTVLSLFYYFSFIFHFIDSVFASTLQKRKMEIMKNAKFIHDIVNGEYYQQKLQSDNFLKSLFNITFTMNTDGVQIFSSSKMNCWPVFLTINELPAIMRLGFIHL